MTVLAGYIKFLFKILGFHNVKPHTFVKLAKLATIRNFFSPAYLLKAMLNCC